MPLFEDLKDHLSSATIFSKLDLRSGYHHIRIQANDVRKIPFKTSEGLFEWKVMSFWLCNAPSIFMRLMIEILKTFLDSSCLVYFDNILVYYPSWEKHLVHLHHILELLRTQQLYLIKDNWHFPSTSIPLLGYIITFHGINVDPTKIDTIKEWLTPKSFTKIHSFHGLANFYKRFILGFSVVMAPIKDYLK